MRPTSSPVELANAFLRYTDGSFSAEQEQLVMVAVTLADLSLSQRRRWSTLQADRFFELLPPEPMARIEAAMYLMGFYGWLGVVRALCPGVCIDLMDDIREHAPPSTLLSELLRRAVPHLVSDAA